MRFSGNRVLGIGSPIVDLAAKADDVELNEWGVAKGAATLMTDAELDGILAKLEAADRGGVFMSPGGAAGNLLFALSKLGIPTAMHGTVGLDMYGQYFCQEYCKLGGELEHLSFTDRKNTGRCLSLITPDAERSMATSLGAGGDFEASGDFSGFAMVFFEGFVLRSDAAEPLLRAAEKSGAAIAFDLSDVSIVEQHRAEVEKFARNSQVLFANRREAEAFRGKLPPEKLAEKLGELAPVAVVKLGADGCAVKWEDGAVSRHPAIPVAPVDTTAAGDLFQAGFLHGLLAGEPPEVCAYSGAVLASEVIKVFGSAVTPERWTAALVKMRLASFKYR